MLEKSQITEDGAVQIIRTILNQVVENRKGQDNVLYADPGKYSIQSGEVSLTKEHVLHVEPAKISIRPGEIALKLGLGKAEDDAVQKAVREAVAECGAAVADYRRGSERALNFIVGQVMKKTRGKADAGEVHRLVKAEVEKS